MRKRKSLTFLDAFSVGFFVAFAVQQVSSALVRKPRFVARPSGMRVIFMIPALNEAAVIGNTIQNLRAVAPDAYVVVIDDASDDGTDAIVREMGHDSHVRLLRREWPNARQNKARAMNWAALQLLSDPELVGGDLERVALIGVDADGRLPDNYMAQIHGAFSDPHVIAAQNWMRYRQDVAVPAGWRGVVARTMLLQQDIEGFTLSRTQWIRHYAGAAVLTGSGSALRASYVADVLAAGGTPWPEVLLEDFACTAEIKLHNTANRVAYLDAPGEQQGMTEIEPFIRQRARWTQGTMECAPYLPRLWQAGLPLATTAEFSFLLLGPWVMPVIVGLGLSQPLRKRLGWQGLELPPAFTAVQSALPLAIQVYWAWKYQQDRQLPLWTIPYAVATLPIHGVFNTVALAVAYQRYFSGQKGWYKSVRQAEFPDTGSGHLALE